ncbi:hypothetical protein [Symbioplanes lichenis]|uniref:hypothetical protein n=1 Tax=Symbioplanes lichenis TaxID=1629072 RepID=UPI002738E995|nr:hypothetical protein [Actinoplanes lichenis]
MNFYVRTASTAVTQGLLTGIWVGAGGLSPARRRLVRAGAVAGLAAAALVGTGAARTGASGRDVKRSPDEGWLDEAADLQEAVLHTDAELRGNAARQEIADARAAAELKIADEPPIDKRKLIATGVAFAISGGAIVGRRFLERRWLARLERQGHPHPYRALGVRMGAISGASALVSGLTNRN